MLSPWICDALSVLVSKALEHYPYVWWASATEELIVCILERAQNVTVSVCSA